LIFLSIGGVSPFSDTNIPHQGYGVKNYFRIWVRHIAQRFSFQKIPICLFFTNTSRLGRGREAYLFFVQNDETAPFVGRLSNPPVIVCPAPLNRLVPSLDADCLKGINSPLCLFFGDGKNRTITAYGDIAQAYAIFFGVIQNLKMCLHTHN
jgi:hypothetical protein